MKLSDLKRGIAVDGRKNILFGYSCTPTWGCPGVSKGGFSVEVHLDGTLFYTTYILCKQEKTKQKIIIPSKTIENIRNILIKKADKIISIPSSINNGSCDGVCNSFVFGDKKITTFNIKSNDENEVKNRNPIYYESYKNVIQQENFILQLFELITGELAQEGIGITTNRVSFVQEQK